MEDHIGMEAFISGLYKVGMVLLGLWAGRLEWERRKDKDRLEDTYTKKETQEQIDSRLKPIEITLDYITRNQEVQTKLTSEINSSLQNLDKSVSVIQATMPKRKEDRE